MKKMIAVTACLFFLSCGNQTSSSTIGLHNGVSLTPTKSGRNVIPLTVDGSECSGSTSYPNKPCVSITLCGVNGENCQTVSDILLDTGSFGLRVFKSVLNPKTLSSLVAEKKAQSEIGECVQYGDGSSDWGQVMLAQIILGEDASTPVPIQLIDPTFSNLKKYCEGADFTPNQAGFNGILGIGVLTPDCGSTCEQKAANQTYFSCQGQTCKGVSVSQAEQVQNPIPSLFQDNNGLLIELPQVSPEGVSFANGYLVLGIGTQDNNQPSSLVRTFETDANGELVTQFNHKSYPSIFDTGSNGIYFDGSSASLSPCQGSSTRGFTPINGDGFYCPSSLQNLTALALDDRGILANPVSFQIGNFINLAHSPNNVFVEIGGQASEMFDWGLPFYLGKKVFVGIEGTSSPLGSGPYFAF